MLFVISGDYLLYLLTFTTAGDECYIFVVDIDDCYYLLLEEVVRIYCGLLLIVISDDCLNLLVCVVT